MKHTFASLPTREEFFEAFKELNDPVTFVFVYGDNGDEDGETAGAATVGDAYEFLEETLHPGESVVAEINEIDPTP